MRFKQFLIFVLVTQMAKTQLINLIAQAGVTISASSVGTGTPQDILTWSGETLITDPGCFSTLGTTNSFIKVDFGASKQVYTVFIATGGSANGSGFDVLNESSLYIGSNASTPTSSSNTLCANSIGETGFYDCYASGRYLFLQTDAVSKIQICYMAAYNLPNFISLGVAYTLPTGQNLNFLRRTSPIGIKKGPGNREFSTTLLQPGEKWQINLGIARDIEGLTVISKVIQNQDNYYSVFIDSTGQVLDNNVACKDNAGAILKKDAFLEQFNCPRNGAFVTIQNKGNAIIEVYGAAIFAKATCTSCSEFTFLTPTIDNVTLLAYVGGLWFSQSMLFGNCPYLNCPLDFAFSRNNPDTIMSERWGSVSSTFYSDWAILVSAMTENFIGTQDWQISASLVSDATKKIEITHFVIMIFKKEMACQVTAIGSTQSLIIPKSFFLLGQTELKVILPQFTTTPSCNYWLHFSLQDPTLATKGFSIVHDTNASYVSTANQTMAMYDYSLKVLTTDAAVVGDYTVVVMVQVVDVPGVPYTDVNPPVTVNVPVAVRDCQIVVNPATTIDLHVPWESTQISQSIVFTVIGSLCGNISVNKSAKDSLGNIKASFFDGSVGASYDQATGQFNILNVPRSYVGTYVVTLSVSLPDVPIAPFNYSFNVLIEAPSKCIVLTLTYAVNTTLANLVYDIGSGTQIVNLPQVVQTPSCNYIIMMNISNPDSSVALFEPTAGNFQVSVLETDPLKIRTLSIQIAATLKTEPFTGSQPILTLPIQIVYQPAEVPNVLQGMTFSLTSFNTSNPNQLTLTQFSSKKFNLESLESDANCIQTNIENNPSVMINLGSSMQIKTVHLVTAGNSDGTGFNSVASSYLWAGNSLKAEENILCNVQVTESGFYTCIATGMYVFLQLQGQGKLSICHLAAYNYFNVAPLGIAYTTSDPKGDPNSAAVEKPLGIKLNTNIRDFSTISLSLKDSAQPFWQVIFGLQRNIFGVLVILKVLTPDPLNGIKVYVTNGEALTQSNACNVNQISTSSYVSIQCNLTGDRVQIVPTGSSIIELYQIGILQSDQNCVTCPTNFTFLPNQSQITISVKVGDPIIQKSLLYGTCPQLDCQIVQTFTLLQDPLKLPQPFTLTKTGIEFKKISNNLVNTYEYQYSASLWTGSRRLNAASMIISSLKIIITSDGCQISSTDYGGNNYIAQSYFIQSGAVLYALPVPVQTPNCNYHIVYTFKDTPTDNYLIVQVQNKSFLQVDITDFAKANMILTVTLVVQVNYNPTAPYTILATPIVFTINLLDCRLSKSLETIPDIQIKQSGDTYLVNEKFTSTSNCGPLSVTITAFNQKTLLYRVLTGVSYDYTTSQIRLYSYASNEIGTYTMTVKAKYSGSFETEVKFNLIILEKTLETNAQGQIGILLPGGIFMPLGPQPEVIKVQNESPTIQPDGTIAVPLGSDVLNLLSIISELNLPQELLLAQIQSLVPEYEQLLAINQSLRTNEQQDFLDQFEYLLSNNTDYINQDQKWKFPGVIIPRSTNSTAPLNIPIIPIEPLVASLGPVSMLGVFRINFSAPVFMIKPQVLKSKNRLSVNIIWSKTDYVEDPLSAPKYTWKILNVTETFIDVNITFASPLEISQGFRLDQLQVKIDNRYYFRRQTDGEPLSFKSLILQQGLVQQVPSETAFMTLKTVSDKISSIRDSTGIVFIVFIIMNLPKSLFWGLHSCIQFMSMEPEHGASMPANAAFIFQQIKDIAELKVIPTKKLYEKLKWLGTLAKNASALWQAGFYFMLLIAVALLIALLLLLQKLADFCECGCKLHKIVIEKIKRKLMFNTIIRAAQLGYMFHVVTALQGILNKKFEYNIAKDLQELKIKSSSLTKFDKLNAVTYWFLVIFVFTYPIGVTLFLQIRGPKGLRSTEMKEKFGSWFMLINTKLRINLLHTTVFLLRRLIVGISIVVLRAHYNFQLQILLLSCMGVAVFDVVTRPFVTPMLNNLELVNELMILLSICVMHNFSDYIQDQAQRYTIGWVYCGIIISVLILNFIFIGSYVIETVYDFLRKEFWKRYRNKTLPMPIKNLSNKLQRLRMHNQKKEDQKKAKEIQNQVGQTADMILDKSLELGQSVDKSQEKKESSNSFKTDSDIEELEEIKEEEDDYSDASCSQENSNSAEVSCTSPMKQKTKSLNSGRSASVLKSQQSRRSLLDLSDQILVHQTSSKLDRLICQDKELFQDFNSPELKQRTFQGQDVSISNVQFKIDDSKSGLKPFMRKNLDINRVMDRELIDRPNLIGSLFDDPTERASEREETEDIPKASQISEEQSPRINLDLGFNPQPDPLLQFQLPSPMNSNSQDNVEVQYSNNDIDFLKKNMFAATWMSQIDSNREQIVSKLTQSVKDAPNNTDLTILTTIDFRNNEERKAVVSRSPRRAMNHQPKQGQRFKSNEGVALEDPQILDYLENIVLDDERVNQKRIVERNPFQTVNYFRQMSQTPITKDKLNTNCSRNQNYGNIASPMQTVSVSSSQESNPSRKSSQKPQSRLSMSGDQIVRPQHLTLDPSMSQTMTQQFKTQSNFNSRVDKSRDSLRVERHAKRKNQLRDMWHHNIVNSQSLASRHLIVALENKRSRFESDIHKLQQSLQPLDPAKRQLQGIVKNYLASSLTYDKDKLKKVIKLEKQEYKLKKLEAKLSKTNLIKKDFSRGEQSESPK